jgi:two-component system, NarL family, response regulator LiaR
VKAIEVALSNDYHVVLAGVAAMLEPYADTIRVVEQTTDRTMGAPVDVILYDTFGRLPGDDAKLERIVSQNDAKVVVYSWDTYPVGDAMSHGAAGYIHKGLPPDELAAAIVAIAGGHARESARPEVEGEDAGTPTWPGQDVGLSARESEMLTFIARGLTNDEIAKRSYLSINTVKTYIRTAYRKVGVTTRSQAVRWALTHGFDAD